MYTQEESRFNDSGSYGKSNTGTGLKKDAHMAECVPINQPL